MTEVSPAAVRAFLAAPVTYEGTDATTVGELLAEFTLELWQDEPRLASYKSNVYLAAIHAGLIPGVAVDDTIAVLQLEAAEALTEAAIRAMGQPPADVSSALRSMIARKQEAIDTAGTARGLGPAWHEATFTAAEILAVIGGTPEAPEAAHA